MKYAEISKTVVINAPVNKVFDLASDFLIYPKSFGSNSDIRPDTKITCDNGVRFLYKGRFMQLRIAVGVGFLEYNENAGWICKSFKGLDIQTR
jgi:hypothetical protein